MSENTSGVLQRKNKDGDWETIEGDMFEFSTSFARAIQDALEDIIHPVPSDVIIDAKNMINGYYVGDFSRSCIYLNDLLDLEIDNDMLIPYSIDTEYCGKSFYLNVRVDEDPTMDTVIEHLQVAIQILFNNPSNYRIIWGHY